MLFDKNYCFVMSLNFRLKKEGEIEEAYNKWTKNNDIYAIRWLEIYISNLIASLPLEETFDDALQKWNQFKTENQIKQNNNIRSDRDLLEFLNDFGVLFNSRKPAKNKDKAYNKYGKKMARIIGQLNNIDTRIFSKMLISNLDESLDVASKAITQNLTKEIDQLQNKVTDYIVSAKECNEAILYSVDIITSISKDIIENDPKNREPMKKILNELANISNKCSSDVALEIVYRTLEELENNVNVSDELLNPLIIELSQAALQPLPSTKQTTPLKKPISLLDQIKKGTTLKKVAQTSKNVTSKSKNQFISIFERAILSRRKSFEEEEEEEEDTNGNLGFRSENTQMVSCDACNCKNALLQCPCKKSRYCSKECAKKNWNIHKNKCTYHK